MARTKEVIDPRVAEIQDAIEKGKQVFGSKVTLKRLRDKKVKKIFLAANASPVLIDDIDYYAKLANVPVEKLSASNEELGIVCKKPFLINIVSITE